jgi:hypothetical protein
MSGKTQACTIDTERDMQNEAASLTGIIKRYETFLKEMKKSAGGITNAENHTMHGSILTELLSSIMRLNRNDLFVLSFKTNQVITHTAVFV